MVNIQMTDFQAIKYLFRDKIQKEYKRYSDWDTDDLSCIFRSLATNKQYIHYTHAFAELYYTHTFTKLLGILMAYYKKDNVDDIPNITEYKEIKEYTRYIVKIEFEGKMYRFEVLAKDNSFNDLETMRQDSSVKLLSID